METILKIIKVWLFFTLLIQLESNSSGKLSFDQRRFAYFENKMIFIFVKALNKRCYAFGTWYTRDFEADNFKAEATYAIFNLNETRYM